LNDREIYNNWRENILNKGVVCKEDVSNVMLEATELNGAFDLNNFTTLPSAISLEQLFTYEELVKIKVPDEQELTVREFDKLVHVNKIKLEEESYELLSDISSMFMLNLPDDYELDFKETDFTYYDKDDKSIKSYLESDFEPNNINNVVKSLSEIHHIVNVNRYEQSYVMNKYRHIGKRLETFNNKPLKESRLLNTTFKEILSQIFINDIDVSLLYKMLGMNEHVKRPNILTIMNCLNKIKRFTESMISAIKQLNVLLFTSKDGFAKELKSLENLNLSNKNAINILLAIDIIIYTDYLNKQSN
jgi:hypothetical protein